MTRGSIPRFDLYEELEISRLASAEVIEAAYRALVKRHHPDVSRPADAERIKRLNIAREWLVSPTRRQRYDAATAVPGEQPRPTARPAARRTRRAAATAEPATPARPSSPASFGVNSRQVRQFLALLRAVDVPRARELVGGKATLDAAAYTEARGAALAASRTGRNDEWTFAREAASVIAKGKLAHSPLGAEVAVIVADIAGAIVVRDLLSTRDFDLLLAPWTWSEARVIEPAAPAGRAPAPMAVSAQAVAAVLADVHAAVRNLGRTAVVLGRRNPIALGVSGAILVGAIALAMLPRGVPGRPEGAVAALTHDPGPPRASVSPGGVASAAAGSPSIGPSLQPSTSASTSNSPQGSPAPVPAPPTPKATASARPPVPASPTPTPTGPVFTPSPTATPIATPVPTPSPSPAEVCTVVNLVGVNSSNAQLAWTGAGFTGTVLFSPPIPPQYKIAWQSLTPGDTVPCTSDITVSPVAP